MREFQERRALRKIIFSRLALFILLMITAYLFYSNIKIYLRSRDAHTANQLAEKEIKDLEARKTEMEILVGRLQTKAGAEEEIRSKFPVQKLGEKVVLIAGEDGLGKTTENISPLEFFPKIWQFLKSIF